LEFGETELNQVEQVGRYQRQMYLHTFICTYYIALHRTEMFIYFVFEAVPGLPCHISRNLLPTRFFLFTSLRSSPSAVFSVSSVSLILAFSTAVSFSPTFSVPEAWCYESQFIFFAPSGSVHFGSVSLLFNVIEKSQFKIHRIQPLKKLNTRLLKEGHESRVADQFHFQPDPDPANQDFKNRIRILLVLTYRRMN